ncbi:RodZ domain-containing protein [Aggregatibacter kilianii]|uniref:RodZ domain-containing protein n=1 Tax=Aggregatibacter kilianii TaxID=2025884 RepID=UPI000D64900C|nr:RodZ family helix-turn-helix domain-containing protein [Aggregatibacter kilianii]
MNMQNTSEAQPNTAQQTTLGDKFRLAREALNLTPEQVAKEISLRPALVHLIESNQFISETIPATFMRGYVRSYAKFLRIPDSDWVNVINFGSEQKNDLGKNARATRSVNQYSSHNNWIGYLSALVILIVVGMTGMWWWESHQQSNAERDVLVNSYTSAPTTAEVNAVPVKTNGNDVPVPQPTAKIENTLTDNAPKGTHIEIETKPLTDTPVAVNTAPVAPVPQAQTPTSEAPATANVLQSEMDKIGSNEQPANPQGEVQATTEPQSAVENSSVSAAATNDNLHIEVIGNCWISVKDKNRKVLAQKEYKQGDVLSFNEEEPYSLIIGAPGNVRITYKGQAFPLTVDGRVAKFKLPQ